MAPRKISIEELEKWLSFKDVAEELGKMRKGVRHMLEHERRLRGVKTRIGWLIDPASVRAIRLLREDDAERKKKEKREALLREANQTHEVGA